MLIKQLMNKNIGVLITDHNVREVLDICDYSYVMHSGEIIAEGESSTILGELVSFIWIRLNIDGGASRTRADHLVTASDALSQMSYSPYYC